MRASLTGKQLAKLRFAPGILPGPHRAFAAPILVMLYRCLAQQPVRPCGGAGKRAMLPQSLARQVGSMPTACGGGRRWPIALRVWTSGRCPAAFG
jgi:hypothetical protein